MLLRLVTPLALAALVAATPTHPDSLSSSRVVIGPQQIRLALRCQVLSLAEVIPGLDRDGNGTFEAAEVAAKRSEIFAYVASTYRLFTGSDRRLRGGRALISEGLAVHASEADDEAALGWSEGAVDVEMVFASEGRVRDLMLEVTLFHDTSPDHIDLATVLWPDGNEESFALHRNRPRARSDPEGHGALLAFASLGVDHILSGWDHLAFLLALVLGAASLRAVIGIVTAFTVAHSITLVLAASGLVNSSTWSRPVELVIALSIAYVAADNLLHVRRARPHALEAFVFGLVHGLGFAGFLARSLVHEKAKGFALLGFNLGVELGQLAVVCLMVLPFWLWRRRAAQPAGTGFVMPRAVRIVGSAVTCALGLFWFGQRLLG